MTTTIPKKPWYTSMSGWGRAEGKTNKFIVGCNTHQEAEQIAKAAKNRDEMKHINITTKKPHTNNKTHHTSYRNYEQLSGPRKK